MTRRNLLEWMTAAQAKATHGLGLGRFYGQMAGGVVLAAAGAVLVLVAKPGAAWIALPFVALWLLSPVVARWVSLPPPESVADRLSAADQDALRRIARLTWRFFETFVGPDDHGLPPDNFQDDPAPEVAHRTSPTNIGLYLLSTVTARDFGWIGTLEMVERLEATLTTIDGLERYRGHLYNWYDTRDLHPLEPEYVSSVDSGNLAGHLLALSSACRQMIDQPLPVAAALAGIRDTVALTRQAAETIGHDRGGQTLTRRQLEEALDAFEGTGDETPATLDAWADQVGVLAGRSRILSDVAAALSAERGEGAAGELVTWANATRLAVTSHQRDLALLRGQQPSEPSQPFPTIGELADPPAQPAGDGPRDAVMVARRLRGVADQATRLFGEMDFGFLFDPTRKLFSIGFRIREGSLDPSYYDLLASEARLTSFIAIARGDVAPDHWFRLGRVLTPVGRGSALVSWSGSMFEYLMPALVMRSPARSLLDQTYQLVVARQMSYATELGVPWGMSESGFNARDLAQAYQYSGFGVPGLGLKRGLSEDVVVAPYATALGAMIRPEAAVRNFARLRDAGAAGAYGFREALDYTARRLPEGASVAVVRSYMAHHQGMALVALGNVLNDGAMVARFHADPIVEATELLLQERMPRDVLVVRPRAEEVKSAADVRDLVPPVLRRFTSPHDATPRTQLLSNGRYAVMITAAGSGYSRWGDVAVTRWREDVTRDPWGSYLFLRDTDSGAVWSAAHQPSGVEADSYEVIYSEDRAELSRRDGSIATTRDLRPHHVRDRQGARTRLAREPDRLDRVARLARLGDRDHERVLREHRVAVLPLAGDVRLDRDPGPLLDHVPADDAGVVRRAAGENHDPPQVADLAVGEAELVELELPVADAVADRLLDGVRLLVDLLEHEGLETALLGALVVPVDLDDLLLDHLAVGPHERGAGGCDRDDVAVVEVLAPARLAHERGHRRGEEHLAVADADHERRLLAHADEQVGMVVVDHDEREVALELGVGLTHRLGEVAVVVALEQVDDHLGVGLGAELVAFPEQLRLQLAVVLDDPVEHDRHPRVVAPGERMRVPLGDADRVSPSAYGRGRGGSGSRGPPRRPSGTGGCRRRGRSRARPLPTWRGRQSRSHGIRGVRAPG